MEEDSKERWVDCNQIRMMTKELKSQVVKMTKILNKKKTKKRVVLITIFDIRMEGATDDDLLRGIFHAYTAHEYMKSNTAGSDTKQIMLETHAAMSDQMPMFIDHLQEAGWQIGNGYVNVECGSSYRLKIQSI